MPELLLFVIKIDIKKGILPEIRLLSLILHWAPFVSMAYCAYERHAALGIIGLFILRKGISIKNK